MASSGPPAPAAKNAWDSTPPNIRSKYAVQMLESKELVLTGQTTVANAAQTQLSMSSVLQTPANNDPVQFSVTAQMFIQSGHGGWSCVFHAGGRAFRTPGVWLHSGSSRFHVRVSTTANVNEGFDTRAMPQRQWIHVAYIVRNNRLLFYVDGEFEGGMHCAGTILVRPQDPLVLGPDGQFNGFLGRVRHVRVYATALTPEEIKEDMKSKVPILQTPQQDELSLQTSYLHLVNNELGSDITLLVGPNREVIHAHKCILWARCEHFKQLLGSGMRETLSAQIELPNVEMDDMLHVLKFIYAGVVPTSTEVAGRMLAAAEYFLLEPLTTACLDTLHGPAGISVDNVCRLFQMSCKLQNIPLQRFCMDFAAENAQAILERDDLYGLPKDVMRVLLQHIVDKAHTSKVLEEEKTKH